MHACCNAPMVQRADGARLLQRADIQLPAPDNGAPLREVGVDGLELGELPLPLPLPLPQPLPLPLTLREVGSDASPPS